MHIGKDTGEIMQWINKATVQAGLAILAVCLPLFLQGTTVVVTPGEVFAPPIGVYPIDGEYIQDPGGIYQVQFNNKDGSSYIQVTGTPGTASIDGGFLALQFSHGNYLLGIPYTILSATNGVSGTFGAVFSNLNSALVPNLNYLSNTVFLTLVTDFAAFARTGNQREVARILDNNPHVHGDLLYVIQNLLKVPDCQIPYDLDQLSGQQYTSLFQFARLSTQRFLRNLFDPLLFSDSMYSCDCCDDDCDPCDPCEEPCCWYNGLEIWQVSHYGRSFLDGNREARGYKSYNLDALLAVQQRLNDYVKIGVAAFYENDGINYNLNGDASVNSIQGALYGIYEDACIYSLADITFGYHHFNVTRKVHIHHVNRWPNGRPNVFDAGLYNEWGYTWEVTPCLNVQPFAGVEGAYYWYNEFSEKGGDSINLAVRRKNKWVCDSRLGIRINAFLPCDIVFSTDIAWGHAYVKDNTKIKLHFEGVEEEFHIHGAKQKSNAVEGSIYIGARALDMTLFAEADAMTTGNASSYSLMLGIEIPL